MRLFNLRSKKTTLIACTGLLLLTSSAFAESFIASISIINHSSHYIYIAGQNSFSSDIAVNTQFQGPISPGGTAKGAVTFKHRWCILGGNCSIKNSETFTVTYYAKCTVNGQKKQDTITIQGTVSRHLPTVYASQDTYTNPNCVKLVQQSMPNFIQAGTNNIALDLNSL